MRINSEEIGHFLLIMQTCVSKKQLIYIITPPPYYQAVVEGSTMRNGLWEVLDRLFIAYSLKSVRLIP